MPRGFQGETVLLGASRNEGCHGGREDAVEDCEGRRKLAARRMRMPAGCRPWPRSMLGWQMAISSGYPASAAEANSPGQTGPFVKKGLVEVAMLPGTWADSDW
jgi:hypothetical protein